MKTLKKSIWFLLSLFLVFTACDEREFDSPPIKVPTYAGEANTTIQQLKDKYVGQDLVEITENLIIRGIVVANDISGNIYKQIQLQDETAGICIAIDRNNIYGDFRLGQEVFIELQGLYFGLYGGYPQVGYRYSRNNDGVYSIGQVTWELFLEKAFQNGFPAPEKAIAKEFSGIEDISTADVGSLITVHNVYFEEGGTRPFAVPNNGSVQTESKILRSTKSSMTLTARNSSAANFAAQIMPEGAGSITGVLSVFNSTMQITLRDSLDFSFGSGGEGIGTKELPWSIPYAIENQGKDATGWIEGYIVGTVAPGINESNPVKGNSDLIFDAPFLNNTVILAESADVKDWTKVVVVNLPADSEIRNQVNLSDNAANLGVKLKVTGSIANQLGAAGLKVDKGTSAEFVIEDTSISVGNGSKENPFSVSEGIRNQGAVDTLWVKGYIVGSVKNGVTSVSGAGDIEFSAPFTSPTNVLIAGSPTETDHTKCIVVNLPAGQPLRSEVNLLDNPGNVGKELLVFGKLRTYFGLPGLRDNQGSDFELDGAGTTPNPDPDPDPDSGSGATPDSPYSIAGAIANQGKSDQAWIKGYIVGSVKNGVSSVQGAGDIEFAAPFTSPTNVLLADSPTERDYTKCIVVNLPAGQPLRSEVNLLDNPGNAGKELLVKGTLRTYFGLPGSRDNSGEDFELDGTGTTPNPDPDPDPDPDSGSGATSDSPYSIADAIANQGKSEQVWAKGYIVGCVKNGVTSIGSTADCFLGVTSGWDSPTNVILADSPDETDINKCIVVNLPSQKSLRTQVNLLDNPANYKKTLNVKGVLRTYFGKSGLRDSAGEDADFILQ